MFIQLTCGGNLCLFNVHHIVAVFPLEKGAAVWMAGDDSSTSVEEYYEEVRAALDSMTVTARG